MMQQYMKELEQEPFDAEEFVERLAWRTIVETKKSNEDEDFNPILLHDSFVQAIKDLTLLQERQQKKCERLEAAVRDDETVFRKEIYSLQENNKIAVERFNELDGKINHVAHKVLHLGDQLDSVNSPRARVVEAQKLMTYLNEFLIDNPVSNLFNDSAKIVEDADVIQKLHIITQDFPRSKFDKEKQKIDSKYDDTEKALIEQFCIAQSKDDFKKMKEIANLLSNFKGYSRCIDEYIEFSQAGCLRHKDVFPNLLPLCKKNYEVIKEVFNKPEQVMAKFVLNIINSKLKTYIFDRLGSLTDSNYLNMLYDLYSKTSQLTNDFSTFNLGNDKNYLIKLTNNIFQKHVDGYMSIELRCLRDICMAHLQRYYESKNHHKKQLQSGGFQDLRRDLQAVLGTRANINIAQIDDYGGETFLSEELAITILQETKLAFQRCQLLSRPEEKSANATQILDRLLNSLLTEHVDYAVELGLQAVPVVEGSKAPPTLYFFTIVHQCNNIIHLFEKQYVDSIEPLIKNTSHHNDCLSKKKFVLEDIERKINTGLDRSLNAVVMWVKLYLQSEQKKNDFKPETDDFDTVASQACTNVVQYITNIIGQINGNLDGNNVNTVLQELGVRLHRIIYDHMLQFQYNTAGAMIAICDLNEYRSCTKSLGPLVAKLFETLHALCNLLLVKPENLQHFTSEDSLVDIDRAVVHTFIQLRSDFKSQKQNILKK